MTRCNIAATRNGARPPKGSSDHKGKYDVLQFLWLSMIYFKLSLLKQKNIIQMAVQIQQDLIVFLVFTFCDLMMPYGNINMGQHWLR